MLPRQLTASSFAQYPPEGKRLAIARLEILRQLPLALTPLLLRELILLDWKFPAERAELDRQFTYLSRLNAAELARAVAPFAKLQLSPALEGSDWVSSPASFSEQLTAHLWATHQIESFRAAATEYVQEANRSTQQPLPIHRIGIVLIGAGASGTDYRLFRKLAPHGVRYTNVDPKDGLATLLGVLQARSSAYAAPYAHWYIDGGAAADLQGVSCVSYGALTSVRAALQNRMQRTYEAGQFDPEAFRTSMARTSPSELGLTALKDPVLDRFQISLLTEGSGTQVFATTFVQWAAREALRRAEPLSLLARFTPRQRERPMNELLTEAQRPPALDASGSLIDADMGAYYTWLNQQRLPGAENSKFLVWQEGGPQAVLIGKGLPQAQQNASRVTLHDLTNLLT